MSLSTRLFHYRKIGLTYSRCRRLKSLNWSADRLKVKRQHTVAVQPHIDAKDGFSALFVSGAFQDEHLLLTVDLDFEKILNRSELISNLQARNLTNFDIDELLENFQKLSRIQAEIEDLSAEKIKIASDFDVYKIKIKNASPEEKVALEEEKKQLKLKGKQAKETMHQLMNPFWDVEQKVMLPALKLPNTLHKDTPRDNTLAILDSHGSTENIIFPKEQLQERIKKCVKFSNIGKKSYYLKSDAALKEHSLINKLSSELREGGFTQMACPELFRPIVVEGAGIDPMDPKEIYNLEVIHAPEVYHHILPFKEYIRGTSVLSFLAYFTKMLVSAEDLPRKFFTLGRSYNVEEEISDLPWLYGTPQSICAEVAAMCRSSEENEAMYHDLQNALWKSLSQLDIPARLVMLPSQSLHLSERKRTEVQLWSPSLQQYVQVGSLSCYGEYLSRRLMFRQTPDVNSDLSNSKPVYTIHGRWANITRLVALHLEHRNCSGSTTTQIQHTEVV